MHMNFQYGYTVMRMSFESVLDQLRTELVKEGFEISGVTDFQKLQSANGDSTGRYTILSVYHSLLYKEMFTIAPREGTILPCLISVVEIYPGETMLVPFNVTEVACADNQNSLLQPLAREVTRRVEMAIHALEKNKPVIRTWSPHGVDEIEDSPRDDGHEFKTHW
jgi:uncharacterized protein (DUF302 family)